MDPAPPVTPARIHAIDAIRGFCLLNIFVNHITTGVFRGASPSRILFFDSAEAFVFLAGISCALAFCADGTRVFDRPARHRVWNRAATLFVVNSLIALASIAILVIAGRFAPPVEPALFPAELIAQHGLGTYIAHVLTMQETVGYSAILRLYVALMIAAPAYIWLASRRWWSPLLPAGAIWLVAGTLGWAEHRSLSGVPLALTILPWNLVFAAGIALGAAIMQGVRMPRGSLATVTSWAAGILLVAGPLCFTILARAVPGMLDWIDTRNDMFWAGASKSLQSPLRVASLFAAAWLCIAWARAPVVRLIHDVAPDNPLVRLGRQSLEVFAFGAVMALVADQVLWAMMSGGETSTSARIVVECVFLIGGVAAMLQIAGRPNMRIASVAWFGRARRSAAHKRRNA